MATTILQGLTQQVPIIQAAGGKPPTAQQNVTGFTIDALATAQSQIDNIASQQLTILWDDTPNPDAQNPANPSRWVYEQLNFRGKQIFDLNVRFSDPNGLTQLDVNKRKNAFMLIPNAMYFNHRDDIVAFVAGKVAEIYYPEREYKKRHGTKTGVKVLGHDIPLTFRMAAHYVDDVLDGTLTAANLPAFKEAIKDEN